MSAFEFDGAKYQRSSRHQKGWGSGLIDSIAFRGDESILDLGCGDGALTAQLATLVPGGHVLGIDASAGMLETARQTSVGSSATSSSSKWCKEPSNQTGAASNHFDE